MLVIKELNQKLFWTRAVDKIISNIMSPHTVISRPATTTSAPQTTVYKVPGVLRQTPKLRTDRFLKTNSGGSSQTRAVAGKTIPRIEASRSQKTVNGRKIPGVAPIFTTAVTSGVSRTERDDLRKTLSHLNLSTSDRNTSGATPDQVQPDRSKISSTISKTSAVAGTPAAGESAPTFCICFNTGTRRPCQQHRCCRLRGLQERINT